MNNALREQAFDKFCAVFIQSLQKIYHPPVEAMPHIVQSGMKCGRGLKCFKVVTFGIDEMISSSGLHYGVGFGPGYRHVGVARAALHPT